ncbi:UNVERIFIED_CONTAM: hypothetical protein GTU68_049276 [Idotea baltica]|nr:hypothetical protein [Idotea baltica]
MNNINKEIILIDNYDSFTYNLVDLLKNCTKKFNLEITVFRNDKITVNDIKKIKPDLIVFSPGPGNTKDSGVCLEIANSNLGIPLIGICLGHQVIAKSYGANIIQSGKATHGKANQLDYINQDFFNNLKLDFNVARYHSLIIDPSTLPDCLEILCKYQDVIMGIKHKEKKEYGLQFHPESFLTCNGDQILNLLIEEIFND